MGFEFDNPPKFGRGYREFTFERETATPLTGDDEETSDAINAGLTTMMSCANVLLRARAEQRISFAPGVTATMLETMGVLLMRAAHTGSTRREAVLQHWVEDGPQKIEDLVARVETRQGKMLMPEDLASMCMGKPPGY